MSFSNSAAFWGLLLAAPIIAVYLIRNRPKNRTVSTLLFWEQVLEEPGVTSLFRQLRSPGSLLFQLAILGLMVLALSRPAFRSVTRQAERQVLIIDNSASMQAVTEKGQSRFDSATDEAHSIIEAASPDTEIMLLVSCPSPTVVCPSTMSRALAQIRLSELAPTDCVGDIRSARRFAEATVNDDLNTSIVIITDGGEQTESSDAHSLYQFEPAEETTKASPDISTIIVGEDVDNVAMTGFQARRDASDPTLWQLYYEVSNFSDAPRELNLELRQNSTLIDLIPVQLEAGKSSRGVVSRTSAEGGLLVGRLREIDPETPWSDGLAIDDRVTTVISDRLPIKVTLVTSGNWFLQQFLVANPLVDLRVINVHNDWRPPADDDGIVIFDSIVPQLWTTTESSRPIRALVVAPSTSCPLWTVKGTIDETFVGNFDRKHPLVEYVQLEDIAINSASNLTVDHRSEVIVSAIEGQPLLTTFNLGRDRVVMLAIDLDRSDLPLRTSFPILLTNALEWLSEPNPDLMPHALPGRSTELSIQGFTRTGEQSQNWLLDGPVGPTREIPVIDGVASLGPLTRVGTYTLQPATSLESPTEKTRRIIIPCNLTSKSESRLMQPQSSPLTRNAQRAAVHGYWWNFQSLLLFALILAVLVECWTWHRRVTE